MSNEIFYKIIEKEEQLHNKLAELEDKLDFETQLKLLNELLKICKKYEKGENK